MYEQFLEWWKDKKIRGIFCFDQELAYTVFTEIWIMGKKDGEE